MTVAVAVLAAVLAVVAAIGGRLIVRIEPSDPERIVTVRGVGYKYAEPAASAACKAGG
ncbi:MAG: hypothetical protein OXG47_06345 [bacterium]|nr:hypothetical protein [bacterium]